MSSWTHWYLQIITKLLYSLNTVKYQYSLVLFMLKTMELDYIVLWGIIKNHTTITNIIFKRYPLI